MALDENRSKLKQALDAALNSMNVASKSIGDLMKAGKKTEAEVLKAEVATWKEKEKNLKEQVAALERKQMDTPVLLPNLPHALVLLVNIYRDTV